MIFNQLTIPCSDYDSSVSFYKLLGIRHIVDNPPQYARFETDGGTTFSIHAVESIPDDTGVVIYFEVEHVDDMVDQLRKKGIEIEEEPCDQAWLWREAYLRDPAGNRICIYNAGENRRYPPWRLED